MNTIKVEKSINIATPIVWANHEDVAQYIENIDQLILEVNRTLKGDGYKIGKAVIDTYGEVDCGRLPDYDSISVICHSTNQADVLGMAHYWYQSVKRAFQCALSERVDGVLYYPVDVSFKREPNNTVSDPENIAELVRFMMKQDSEYIAIGNYKSTIVNREKIETAVNKEKIEAAVQFILRNECPSLDSKVKRVRSEFWGISPGLFSEFTAFYYGSFQERKKKIEKDDSGPVKDPTLMILLYCLLCNKKIAPFELGYYEVNDTYPPKKREKQITRAVKLIYDFLDWFGGAAR